jgi:protein arginine N-methyltransferase 1
MYSLAAYGKMIVDQVRMDAFEKALEQVIRPGDVVVDLGAGTGVMSLLACRLGAATVYAIDVSDFIHLAAHVASENGVEDRVRFFQGDSRHLTLPEPADVIVSDLRGPLPWSPGHIRTIADARRRFLRTGGNLIGRRDVVYAALVEAPEEDDRIRSPWKDRPRGLQMSSAVQASLNRCTGADLAAKHVVGPPSVVAVVDYTEVESPDLDAAFALVAERHATAHGFVLWFEAELADGIGFSTAPKDVERTVYGTDFFPFLKPLAVDKDSSVDVALAAREGDGKYHWSWTTRSGNDENRGVQHQSTIFNTPPSQAVETVPGPLHVLDLNSLGRVARTTLNLVDGSRSIEEIARRLLAEYPGDFQSNEEAEHRVRSIVGRFMRGFGED